MKTILSLIFFIIFSGNMLFAQITVILSSQNVTCYGACNGFIHAEATGGTPPYTYNWSPPMPPFQDQVGLCAGLYTCIVTDVNNVTGYNQVNITQPMPLSDIISSTDDNGTGNGTVSVTASGGTPQYIYQWDYNNDPTPSGLAAGWYYVTIIDAQGCTKNDSVEVHLWSEVVTQKTDDAYTLYPNPVKNDFNLLITTGIAENISLVIYNSIGEIILTKKLLLASGENIQNIDIQQAKAGIYFIKLQGINKSSYLKFTKTE